MPTTTLLIQDYLRTQGLRLSVEDVHIAYLAAQAVINSGNASIDRSVLWFAGDEMVLADHIGQTDENEQRLKQIFMALDSVYSRHPDTLNATVYALAPPMPQDSRLIRLAHQGEKTEQVLDTGEDGSRTHLASRTAQSGWMNIADDTHKWMEQGELEGTRNHKAASQISAPIATENGKVLGVLHVEYAEKGQTDETALTDWTALAIALSEPLRQLLGVEDNAESGDSQ